ncbi:MAG: DUF1801 domain-containing protein [Gemmatimonadaceae bacterium]|jgi:hypothetical protein|nr:DUF1801 domain-containing protein [Gemmatimonadaceae bacterium]
MYKAKTTATRESVTAHIAAIADDTRRADCKQLVTIMKRVTGCAPKMWGPSIIGFDSYHYRYDTGHEGDACLVGFASGAQHISLYLMAGYESAETKALLAKLGKHKLGKACLYIKRLADVDVGVLETLIARSAAVIRAKYPSKA